MYEPVRRVHNDYTHASAIKRVRQLLGEAEAERRLKRRLAIINVWRPLFGPVQDAQDMLAVFREAVAGTRSGSVVVVEVQVAAEYDDAIARTMVRGSQ